MRVIFMGTPEFAVPSLERLAQKHQVVAVYVRPDAVSGRGRGAKPSAVKVAASHLGLQVRQPATLRDPETLLELTRTAADIICVAAYGLILPEAVLEAADLGAINVHASLLPRWRGAAPIQRAILAGDDYLGVSIMRMEKGLDTGPFCLQEAVPAEQKNSAELTRELAEIGARLLVAALPGIADGSAAWTVQSGDDATYASKVTKDDVAPDPGLSAHENILRVRASSPAAPARLLVGERGLTVIDAVADPVSPELASGAVRQQGDGVALGTSPGVVVIRRIKPDGKAEMDASAWARGAHLASDETWRSSR